jgi:SAM-dependent MidA family methyltransferase
LIAILREKIAADGPLGFADFMAAALYHPQLGYYAKQTRQVGRAGDFYTSVSVGPLFGKLLARRFLNWWQSAGTPENWRVIESGAHDGTLAADVLTELRTLDAAAFSALEYVIPEPLPLLQAAQRTTLAAFPNVRLFTDPAELARRPLPGIAFGNEVLDALPFHVIERQNGEWRDCLVDFQKGEFVWQTGGIFPHGPAGDFPDGYRTEIRDNFGKFFQPLLHGLTSGLLIFPDYGYDRPDYYHPDRRTGTLRTFSKHRAAEDPLATPGDIDITAHVDFTAATEAAAALGCQPLALRSQGSWLTHLARDWLISLEGNPDPAALRQFQALTHPAHLGAKFHVLELAWKP